MSSAAAGTAGVVTNYAANIVAIQNGMTVGPDGSLWFINNGFSIGRITTDG